MHLPSKSERKYLTALLESIHVEPTARAKKLRYWELLLKSEAFDKFCAKKFPSVKRYGLEGAEAMMIAMEEIVCHAEVEEVADIVL